MLSAEEFPQVDPAARAREIHPLYPVALNIERALLPLLQRKGSWYERGIIRVVDRHAHRCGEESALSVQMFIPNGTHRNTWTRGNRPVTGSLAFVFVCESRERITLVDPRAHRAWEFPFERLAPHIAKAYGLVGVPLPMPLRLV